MEEKELKELCIKCLTEELPVLRKIVGLTQNELADIMGVSRQTITNIESGAYKMKWTTFIALMFIFSLDKSAFSYLKASEIPYAELKSWLSGKKKGSKRL